MHRGGRQRNDLPVFREPAYGRQLYSPYYNGEQINPTLHLSDVKEDIVVKVNEFDHNDSVVNVSFRTVANTVAIYYDFVIPEGEGIYSAEVEFNFPFNKHELVAYSATSPRIDIFTEWQSNKLTVRFQQKASHKSFEYRIRELVIIQH